MALTRSAAACKRKFLDIFPGGFHDPTYVEWERSYKWDAHRRWADALGKATFRSLLDTGAHKDAATAAVRIESRTNLLFSFEKMAVRDAVATGPGARMFATGLYDWLHGPGRERDKFERWCETVAALPRRQTRVATWPVITVFGFIGRPRVHVFLKPTVTRVAADAYGFDFQYHSRPTWDTYGSLLDFARTVQRDMADLRPRDMIDVQSFIWVQGSAEYG